MVIEILDLNLPALAPYARLTEAQLRNRKEPELGIFIAESPKVIQTALENGYQPQSFLMERPHLTGDAGHILEQFPDVPVYTAERRVLEKLTGYTLTRGVLCAMRRPAMQDIEAVLSGASRVAVLEGIVDASNLGAIFRSAAALGMDAVLLTSTCCDPFNRRCVRVSMGTVFQVPWTVTDDWLSILHEKGFFTAAMALEKDSVSMDDESLCKAEKLALVFGTEGDGLNKQTIAQCRATVMIPMCHGVDSLNVAAASAVAFWQVRKK